MTNLLEMNPSQLCQEVLSLTDIASKAGEARIGLIRNHALFYQSFREEHKSDAGLERAWELTKDGLDLIEINQKIKNIDRKISAIKVFLRNKENEAKNQW
jgi:hypothetical protein